MTTNVYCLKWNPPSVDYIALDLPPDTNDAYFMCCNSDGSVVAGYIYDRSTNSTHPLRWNGTSYTQLTGGFVPLSMSQDGNTIYGYATNNLGTPVVWQDNATAATVLPPPPGYNTVLQAAARTMSDDGSMIYGACWNSTTNDHAIVKWTNTVPTVIFTPTVWPYPDVICVSNDGSLVVGGLTGGTMWCGYFTGGTFRRLAPLTTSNVNGTAPFCSGDGTVIYGQLVDANSVLRTVYWNNLGTQTGTYSGTAYYGTVHILNAPAAAVIEAVGNDPYICVGENKTVLWSFASRWDGTAYTNLIAPDSLNLNSRAMACSGDAGIIAGNSYTTTGACYWDNSGVTYTLKRPGGTYGSYAPLVSRDGSTIFGHAYPYSTSAMWDIRAGSISDAGVGYLWFDPSYVDFSNPTTRAGFVNPDGSYLPLGWTGELPTGTSPMDYLFIPDSGTPSDFLYGAYGNDYNQSRWDYNSYGVDPTTGSYYPNLDFDICVTPSTSILSMDDLLVTQWMSGSPHEHKVSLRYSDDRGGSWSNALEQDLGAEGEFLVDLQWQRLGYSRDRVIELSWSADTMTALTGVFLQVEMARS